VLDDGLRHVNLKEKDLLLSKQDLKYRSDFSVGQNNDMVIPLELCEVNEIDLLTSVSVVSGEYQTERQNAKGDRWSYDDSDINYDEKRSGVNSEGHYSCPSPSRQSHPFNQIKLDIIETQAPPFPLYSRSIKFGNDIIECKPHGSHSSIISI
jgi:hypothetical protein